MIRAIRTVTRSAYHGGRSDVASETTLDDGATIASAVDVPARIAEQRP